MTWPVYSKQLRRDMDALLKKGGSLSAYRASKKFGLGPIEGSWAWKLEQEIQKRFKVRHAVACNSGTAALHMALEGVGVRGGEVITTPYSFSATASAILLAGATPVFADVDPFSYTISKETVGKHVTKKTKGILPVDLFGGMADISGLSSFGIPVVEDACQAVGARTDAGYSGTNSLAGCYSFNGAKNIPCGEGGALVTNSSDIAEKARLLANHWENFGDGIGYNYRINEQTALIAYYGVLALEERNRKRIELVSVLASTLDDIDAKTGIHDHINFTWPTDGSHVYYCTPFTFEDRWTKTVDRAKFIKRMAKRGIVVGAGYIQPTLNRYAAFAKYQRGPLINAETLSAHTLCLLYDMHSEQPLSYPKRVAQAMKESLS